MKRISFEPTNDPDFVRKISGDPSWTYRERQNPLWENLLLGGVVLLILLVCLGLPYLLDPTDNVFFMGTVVPVVLLSCIPIIPFMGGIRFDVSREKIVARLGIIGLRILTIDIRNVAKIDLATFSPMMDFGGWGIKWNDYQKVWGYFWSGGEGVFLTLKDDKRILLGSYTPKLLAEAIHAAKQYEKEP